MTAPIRGGAPARAPRLAAETLLLAHRAGNDLERLRLAESAGADVVEADVHLHRGRLELRHVKRLRPLPVVWDRWYVESAPGRYLQLEDVLAASRPETRLLLDLKGVDGRLPRRLVATLARAGAERDVTVCSRTWRLLDRLPRNGSPRRVLSAGNERVLGSGTFSATRKGPPPNSDPQGATSLMSGLAADLAHKLAQVIKQPEA